MDRPEFCSRCHKTPIEKDNVPYTFDWCSAWLCDPCARALYQDEEDQIRNDLGMRPEDPVTLG